VTCPETTYTPCLTPAQVTVAREIYDGPNDPQGRLRYPVDSPGAHYTRWIGNYLFFQPIGSGGRDRGYSRRG
jgi:hypothetical protein